MNKTCLLTLLLAALVGCQTPASQTNPTPPSPTTLSSSEPVSPVVPSQPPVAPSATPPAAAGTSNARINLVFPQRDAVQVALNAKLAVTFSEAMDPASLNANSLILTGPDARPVAGTVTYLGNVATFTPSTPLAANTRYNAQINTSARDLAGLALSAEQRWGFSTGNTADTTSPKSGYANPDSGSTRVSVNGKLAVTFSEFMDPLSLNSQTFLVTGPDGRAVSGSVTYAGQIATFTPDRNLEANTLYTVRLTTGISDLAGNPLDAEKTWTFKTGSSGSSGSGSSGSGSSSPVDRTAPLLNSFTPGVGAVDIPTNAKVVAIFNEAMDPVSVLAAFRVLNAASEEISGVLSYVGNVVTFTPTLALETTMPYTVILDGTAEDLAGNALGSTRTWSFTSGITEDSTPPEINTPSPINGATNVAINGQLSASFSEVMDPVSLNADTFTVTDEDGDSVAGTVSYAGNLATFTPNSPLAPNTLHTVTLTTGVTDLTGNPLSASESWTFTTGNAPDTVRPVVSLTSPASDIFNVAITNPLTVTFSEAMDPDTLDVDSYTLKDADNVTVPGTISYGGSGTVAIFTPDSPLDTYTRYTAQLSTSVGDLAGNTLRNAKTWSFTTATPLQAPVPLGTAGNFVILAKTGISTVPTSAITGDIGVSPIVLTAMTGFTETLHSSGAYATSPQVTGRLYAANLAGTTPTDLTTAVSNMETAYTNAASRVTPDFTNFNSGEIGSQNLVPGLYKWGTGVTISNNVTLTGGANDVWIFQISGNLTQAANKIVTLAGGAQAKNVFWQLSGAANLGAGAQFKGILISQTGINLQTGASVTGRLLAQTAVTLQKSTVTAP